MQRGNSQSRYIGTWRRKTTGILYKERRFVCQKVEPGLLIGRVVDVMVDGNTIQYNQSWPEAWINSGRWEKISDSTESEERA